MRLSSNHVFLCGRGGKYHFADLAYTLVLQEIHLRTNIILYLNDINRILDQNDSMLSKRFNTYIRFHSSRDLKKAFDTVDYNILFKKLHKLD